ncbi:MAG: DUF4412 domain-containing protein [Candidatus Firestonebacteria bacterium]|nr:DUF4412 domain-containing protein [Candidatus Firestonebacteria bacterium]
MKNLVFQIFILIFIFFVSLTSIYSGTIIEQSEGSSNFDKIITTIVYFSANNMRTDDPENKATTISLLGEDIGYYISHKKKSYLKYKLSERFKNLSNTQMKDNENNHEELPPKRKIDIKKTDEKKTINGFKVVKINIMANNELIEEDWVTNDMDMTEVKNIIEKLKKQNPNVQYQNSEEYEITKAIENYGFPILSKRYSIFLDEKVEDFIEIKKIEKKNLKNNVFAPPSEYKEVK